MAKKHGQGSPVAENGDAIGDLCGIKRRAPHAIDARRASVAASARNIQGAQTHDGFERGAAFEPAEGDYRERKNSPYRALKYVQDFAMALKPADFASLPALINALRVTCTYKKPVYWRERLSNDKYCPSVEKYNFRSEHPGDFRAVLFQLTTAGVLAREQARRKSRRFNEYDNYGPDGPEFPGI